MTRIGFISEKYRLSNDRLFWLLQVAGWLGLALLTYISLTLSFNQTSLPYVLHPFVQSLLGIVISWPMRAIFRNLWQVSIPLRLTLVVATVLIFALAWNYLRLLTFVQMTGEAMDFSQELKVWFFSGALVFSCWAAFYHGFRYYRLLQQEHESLLLAEREMHAEQRKRENAERLAQKSQLMMLRYQLNPHFLFNTLNAITSLINSGRNSEAGRIVDALSAFLRDALKGDPLRRVTLREEITSLENYLSIEKTRFGDRLDHEITATEADPEFPVPGLILQPLAENVVKHVVRTSSQPVKLTVRAVSRGDELEIEVSDNGPGIPGLKDGELPQNGIGLKNVRDRLENMYGRGFELRLLEADGGGLRIVIRIPAEREPLAVPADESS